MTALDNINCNLTKPQCQEIVPKRIAQNEEGKTVEIAISATVFFSQSGRTLVNSPGLGIAKEGENGGLIDIGLRLEELEVASIILYQSSLSDFTFKNVNLEVLLKDNLRAVLNNAINESERICGSITPIVFADGHSAGASTIAVVAPEYSCVIKILLIAPPLTTGLRRL